MSYPLAFHPDVHPEVDEAYQWYERQLTGLGEDFLTALDAVFDRLQRYPLVHQVIYRSNVRRTKTKRFPYCIYYRVHTDRVEIIAVQDGRRNPDDWQSRV